MWYSLLDDDGDEYYWNPATGATAWEVPDDEAIILAAAPGPTVTGAHPVATAIGPTAGAPARADDDASAATEVGRANATNPLPSPSSPPDTFADDFSDAAAGATSALTASPHKLSPAHVGPTRTLYAAAPADVSDATLGEAAADARLE